jgi:hypothetical protein
VQMHLLIRIDTPDTVRYALHTPAATSYNPLVLPAPRAPPLIASPGQRFALVHPQLHHSPPSRQCTTLTRNISSFPSLADSTYSPQSAKLKLCAAIGFFQTSLLLNLPCVSPAWRALQSVGEWRAWDDILLFSIPLSRAMSP